MRYTRLWLLILCVVSTVTAESRWRKAWRWSTVALVSAATADISSSIGQYEANPLARQANGRFSVGRGVILKAGVCTGLILLGKKDKRVSTIANFTAGGVWTGAAIRNWRLQGGKQTLESSSPH
jgi:hypothetical protein